MDFLLENQAHDFLETENDKVNLFCESLAVPKDVLPAKVYEGGPGSHPTIRYFVDKFPLFLAAPLSGASPVVTFGYVDSGTRSPWSFVAHLGAYQGLFRHLKTFRLLYIALRATEFRRAEDRFRASVKQPLEPDVSSEVLRYFEVRRKWENHEYVVPVATDFEFLNDARLRFHGERFEGLYQAWVTGRIAETELRPEFSHLAPPRTIFFDTYLVRNHSLLARSCGRDGHGRVFEAPGRRGIQKRSSGEGWVGFYAFYEKPLSCTCCTQIRARSHSRKRSVKH